MYCTRGWNPCSNGSRSRVDKNAGSINREFLDWLSYRQGQERPFFAFLNYYDAHAPYLPPEGAGFASACGPELWTIISS